MRARLAPVYLWTNIVLGTAVVLWACLNWHCDDRLRFISFLTAGVIASALKIRLPGVTSTASVSVLVIVVAIAELSLPEAVLIGTLSMLTQCVWRTRTRPRAIQVAFSACTLATSVAVSALAYSRVRTHTLEIVSLATIAVVYFLVNILLVASIISLTEGKPLLMVWKANRWALAYYLVGASLAALIGTVPHSLQWELPLTCLPVVYLVHRSNRTYVVQIEQEKGHVEQMNALHLRTIEALALAIDAKDHTTHDHLERVQLYALEIGKDLKLSAEEMEALRAAAVLHDIGKLAVPEHIISKPGKLTRAEFEKMKIHPVVGAEILERVVFPYPVVPIVRAHHEKWDGSGYPDGLQGTEIPIGARILAAVDCFDALASDRQYRRALPLDEAMAIVASEKGKSFDPAVVRVLQA
jgi:putative nucleotidyltransferase with HDIG domain